MIDQIGALKVESSLIISIFKRRLGRIILYSGVSSTGGSYLRLSMSEIR